MRVKVRRSRHITFGLFGAELWWDVVITGALSDEHIAIVRNWRDALVVARLAALGIQRLTDQPNRTQEGD